MSTTLELAATARAKLTVAEMGAGVSEAERLIRARAILEARDRLVASGETSAAGVITDLFYESASRIDPRVVAERRGL